jgi:hypothetical protein
MALNFTSACKIMARALGAGLLALTLAGCRWTSEAPLLTKEQADWSPLKPGAYAHGNQLYEIEGSKSGPVVVTKKVENEADTYSVAFLKLGGKFYLVQAVTGSEVNYLIIQTNKAGFIQYRPDCKDENRAIATTSGATLTADETCQFLSLASLEKAAKIATASIKGGGPGFAGEAFIRKQ